jgi:hypothetical protein
MTLLLFLLLLFTVVVISNLLKQKNDLKSLLERVLDDATADVDYPKSRIWAIRSKLYRKISSVINYNYDSTRANLDEDYPR